MSVLMSLKKVVGTAIAVAIAFAIADIKPSEFSFNTKVVLIFVLFTVVSVGLNYFFYRNRRYSEGISAVVSLLFASIAIGFPGLAWLL